MSERLDEPREHSTAEVSGDIDGYFSLAEGPGVLVLLSLK